MKHGGCGAACRRDAGTHVVATPAFELRLRHLHAADAPELFGLVERNREHLRRWLPWVDATLSEADCGAFIDMAADAAARGAERHWGVFEGSALIGMAGFHSVDAAARSTELGYWIAAPQQGTGRMLEAVRHLVSYGFYGFALARVIVRCDVANERSRRIPERLGFTLEPADDVAANEPAAHARYVMPADAWERGA